METSITQMGQDLAFAGYAKKTQDSYLRTVQQLAAHYGRPLVDLGRAELRAYVEHLRERGHKRTQCRIARSHTDLTGPAIEVW